MAATPESITAEQLSAPEVIADPYPFYAALREQSPVYGYRDLPPGTVPGADEPPPAWALLTHEQVTFASRHPELFSSRDPLQEESDAPTLMLVNHDDPEHRALRSLVQPAFVTSQVRKHEAWITDRIGTMLDEFADREFDAMPTLAAEIPALVMSRMLEMPEQDAPRFRQWATAFMLSTPLTPEQRNQSNADMIGYFTDKVLRCADGREDNAFIQTLLTARDVERQLSPEEVIRFCFTLVVAGAETTTGLLGNLLWIAATEPESYRAVREDPDRIDDFIEEALRYAGPPQRLFRVATRDTRLGHADIRAGDWVAIFFAAANHDPTVWEDPHTFRLGREHARQHYSFGHGVHACLGSMLVRLEARCLLREVCRRFARVLPGRAPFVRQTATQLSYALDACPVILSTTP